MGERFTMILNFFDRLRQRARLLLCRVTLAFDHLEQLAGLERLR